jgi:aspartyl-tRNA(Asn)/glutamyl-tRNA(Gln) amidotransferase subunit B
MSKKEGYKVTIGLEIHAELKTRTKMFCDSKNDSEEKKPNINICPVCLGYPGTLPTINKEAVRQVLRVGIAVGGEIADFTEFDRKNYFYPDIPKGYQISQYKFPLVKGGSINGVELTRVHLEEDTARSTHGANYSLVDFNRAGIPLMELVTEPVIRSAEEASKFAKELQLLLQYLDAADANMDKGEMRVEANVSVSLDEKFGTKVEVKNLNSFKSVEKAISYEVSRHVSLLENGEKVIQETRGWDEVKQKTFSQRVKEYSHDYRYFPEPDIPKLQISKIEEFGKKELQKTLPELPWQRRERYLKLGIKVEDADTFVNWPKWGSYFDSAIKHISDEKLYQTAANYITSDIFGLIKINSTVQTFDDLVSEVIKNIPAEQFAILINMVTTKKISSRGAKEILRIMYESGKGTENIATESGLLLRQDNGLLQEVADKVVTDNPEVVSDYKNGKTSAIQFLVGQGMKISKGSLDPTSLKETLEKLI